MVNYIQNTHCVYNIIDVDIKVTFYSLLDLFEGTSEINI